MRKIAYRTNGVLVKISDLIFWAYQANYPIRLRISTSVTKPTLRFNKHWLVIRLPLEYGRYLRLFLRLAKQLRSERNGKHFVKRPKSQSNELVNAKLANGKEQSSEKPTKAPKPSKSREPEPVPAWRREWEALWDRVAEVLFGDALKNANDAT